MVNQHLRFKAPYSTSSKAVHTQIPTTIAIYLLVPFLKNRAPCRLPSIQSYRLQASLFFRKIPF